jgi:hypothetical protein
VSGCILGALFLLTTLVLAARGVTSRTFLCGLGGSGNSSAVTTPSKSTKKRTAGDAPGGKDKGGQKKKRTKVQGSRVHHTVESRTGAGRGVHSIGRIGCILGALLG